VFLFFDSIIHKSCKKESDGITEKTFAREKFFVSREYCTIFCGGGWPRGGRIAGDKSDEMNDKGSILAKTSVSWPQGGEMRREIGEKMQKRAKVFLEFQTKGW